MFSGRLRSCLALEERIQAIDISPDYQLIAVACGISCLVWSTGDFSLKYQLNRTGRALHRKDIRVVKFSPCGGYIATCGEDRKIVIWSLITGGSVHTVLLGHSDLIFDAVFKPATTQAALTTTALLNVASCTSLPLTAAVTVANQVNSNINSDGK